MSFQSLPRLREHRASGRAVVTVRLASGGRKDFYCGAWGTAAAQKEYLRICEVLAANDGLYPSSGTDITVAEVMVKYVRHASSYYGAKTSGLANVKRSMKTVRQLFGSTPAADFGPKALKLVQERWVAEGITRKSINKMTGTVKRAFRWLVSEEVIPADVFHRLEAVEGLRLGRTVAPDNPPVKPADPEDLKKAIAFMPPLVGAICQLQALSGARCGELLGMKSSDIDRTGEAWSFTPIVHKGSWRGKGRTIYFGPEAQSLLAPLILKAGDAYIFNPAAGEAERIAERTSNRKTPRYPSHMARNERKRVGKNRARPWGERYTTNTVRRAIERACDAASEQSVKEGGPPVPRFTPHRLRHLAAVTIRTKFGIEHARAMLGHTIAAMTEHYSRDVDKRLASEVVAKIG